MPRQISANLRKGRHLRGVLVATAIASISSQSHATGIPCVDFAAIGQMIKQYTLEQTEAQVEKLRSQAKMKLDAELNRALQGTILESTSELTARITSTYTDINNVNAREALRPPPSACEMYNSSRNGQNAEQAAANTQSAVVSEYVANQMNMGEDARSPDVRQKEMRNPIFQRFVYDLVNKNELTQLDANNFMRTGKYAGNDVDTRQRISRKDFMDLLTDAPSNQLIDYRRDPSTLTEEDRNLAIEHMKQVARLSLVRGAMAEIYSMGAQEGADTSVTETLRQFNKDRFLKPDWVNTVLNVKKTADSGSQGGDGQASSDKTQAEQVDREILNINAYLAYLNEKRFRLEQWRTAIAAASFARSLE